jgi:hypothetical protein
MEDREVEILVGDGEWKGDLVVLVLVVAMAARVWMWSLAVVAVEVEVVKVEEEMLAAALEALPLVG